jgi:hypothetical protein
MKEGFINFSRLKLNEAPVNPVAVEQQGSEAASSGGQTQREGTNRRREAQSLHMAAKTGSPTQSTQIQKAVTEHLLDIRTGKEVSRLYEEQKSDWRSELAGEDPNEPEHPYVKVMPNIKYKQIEAEKELAAAAKKSTETK